MNLPFRGAPGIVHADWLRHRLKERGAIVYTLESFMLPVSGRLLLRVGDAASRYLSSRPPALLSWLLTED